MTGLDIPEGTNIEKIIMGGDKAFDEIMKLLNTKLLSGYIRVKLKKDDEKITSYMVIEKSQPRLGLRELVRKDEKNPRRRVRRVYAGKNTLNEVKNDFSHENAVIELHTGVDVDSIINKYDRGKKTGEEGPQGTGEDLGPKKIGLFWGGKEQSDALTREVLLEKLNNWEREGYDVSELESAMSLDLEECKAAFGSFEEDVETLKEMEAELEILSLGGFETEVAGLKSKLKDPGNIPEIRGEIEVLEEKMSGAKVPAAGDLCLVCGYRLEGSDRCPRCGAAIQREEAEASEMPGAPIKAESDTMELAPGHCYLIEEERLSDSVKLFTDILNEGFKGLCITRTNPKHIAEFKKLKDVTIMWLTDKESTTESTIPPVLERIMYEISDFLRREENGCLILDGIEYLISNSGFDAVLRFIRRLVDEFSESKSILLVAVSPFTLKERELKILEREMEKVDVE
ncbi:MAG: DUF835 domain-containing protein [Thermoplasmata archaeon]|nr:MAG: DUF835 domain-containing protein [Thermoplasmata archaeon]